MKLKNTVTLATSIVVAGALGVAGSTAANAAQAPVVTAASATADSGGYSQEAFAAEVEYTASLSAEEQDARVQQLMAEASAEAEAVEGRAALPLIPFAVVAACIGSAGYGAYSTYKSGDPVDFIAQTVIGCIPFGAAAKPVVVTLINANKPLVISGLKALGLGANSAIILALGGDS
ncbi:MULTISPECIES: hypothetical protein [unclassified Pseudoclavibacter]|jgi:hypothetical protein|uniref:hypothetical protein n=1 Tax=unclassified Pseudoclavibacter TaxID=2615177 RepID=UPI000CE84243|nr:MULTISPECIES: hypothetical protein [unclassified Pseudoclavibacter]MBS3179872.1 hypothetical protein [Pseudoclavibacter sp. Marseille-Q4354]NYF14319.1 hypothetical protein [Pseudoclavibacter sp. JAI123]PPG31261.1 hypothetical protein C5B97_05865 [Pseudoclavibacter sp. RFBB5]